jgi:hypothetical protein
MTNHQQHTKGQGLLGMREQISLARGMVQSTPESAAEPCKL